MPRSKDATHSVPRGRPSDTRGSAHSSASKREPLSPQAALALYRPDLHESLEAADAPSYRYAQVYEHLLRRPLRPFTLSTALPTGTRGALDALGVSVLSQVASRPAPDGTTKFLLSCSDGALIETVVMRYRDRVTTCVSAQVGCPVGCAFCATGAMGFLRNLSVAEIVDQVRVAAALAGEEERRVSNIVYMGMGEPMLNLQSVLGSIRIITDPHGFALGHRAVAVSSVGIPRGILRLAATEPQVNLALSLHAADDRTRARLIPLGFRHSLAEVLEAAWQHFAATHRKLLVEYVLLHGVNDSLHDARRLAGLLRGHVVTVNLLTWNPPTPADAHGPRGGAGRDPRVTGPAWNPPSSFRPSPQATVAAFRDVLVDSQVEAVVRRSKGSSIGAACGQLAGRLRSYDGPDTG